jgi:hypothetical protein
VSRLRPRLAAVAAALTVGLGGGPARAHHVPGHGASEGVRSINSLGGRGGRSQTRLLLLNELVYANTGLAPNVANSTSLYGEYAPIPELSIAAQAPLLVIRDLDAAGDTRIGYGDTRLQLRFTPHARKLVHRTLSTGITVSAPTRTVKLMVDPGPVTAVSPFVVFTRTYSRHFWQVIGLSVIENRRAGTAVDLSFGAQGGSKVLKGKLSLGLGVLFDLRLANFCADPDGDRSFCAHSRAGEAEREVGSLRALVLSTIAYNISPRWSVIGAIQGPVSPKMDFTVAGSVGAQVFF